MDNGQLLWTMRTSDLLCEVDPFGKTKLDVPEKFKAKNLDPDVKKKLLKRIKQFGLHYHLDAWKFPMHSENFGLSLNYKIMP